MGYVVTSDCTFAIAELFEISCQKSECIFRA